MNFGIAIVVQFLAKDAHMTSAPLVLLSIFDLLDFDFSVNKSVDVGNHYVTLHIH